MQIIKGSEIAADIKKGIEQGNRETGIEPCLAMVLVGDNRESMLYVGLKQKALQASGCRGEVVQLPVGTSKEKLIAVVEDLNHNPAIDGILVQLPLPGELGSHQEEILAVIAPDKDVDGFTPINRGGLLGGSPRFISCAARAAMNVVERVADSLPGRQVLLVGDSFDLIKPLALMFIDRKWRVAVVPRYDKEAAARCDIMVVEKGLPQIVKGVDLKEGAVVIDAGFYWHEGRTVGNVDIESTADREGFLLPVPGGLGPMLIAMLMENLEQAARFRRGYNA